MAIQTVRKVCCDAACPLRAHTCNLNYPGTNGQVGRMNRPIKDVTLKYYHYENHKQLCSHLANFLDAYNFARRLKALNYPNVTIKRIPQTTELRYAKPSLMEMVFPHRIVSPIMPYSKKTIIIAETDAHNQLCGLWISRHKDRVRFMTTEDMLSLSLKDMVVSGAPIDDIETWIKSRIQTAEHAH